MNTLPGCCGRSVWAGVFNLFFACVKVVFIWLFLVTGVLVLAQSSVAPVSVRWLTAYVVKRSVTALTPLRPYFPAPYGVEIETH